MAEKALKPTEEKLKPKLFSVMKTYTTEQFIVQRPEDIEINGEYANVVGLPIARLYHEIKKLGCKEALGRA